MKKFLHIICMLGVLITMSGCESALGKLMNAMRTVWKKYKNSEARTDSSELNENLAKSRVDEVSASERLFLAQLKEIHTIATHPTMDSASRNEKALARIQEFNRQYPSFPPISRDSMEKTIIKPVPKILDSGGADIHNVGQRVYAGTLPNSGFMYEQSTRFEELLPHVYVPSNKQAFVHAVYYRNQWGQPSAVFITDRGYLGGWLVRAHWHYLKKGFVGSDKKEWYLMIDPQKAVHQYLGHEWVNWANTGNYTATGIVGIGAQTSISYWKDRWEVVLDLDDSEFKIINPAWEKTMR